jgi:hypothetical protein
LQKIISYIIVEGPMLVCVWAVRAAWTLSRRGVRVRSLRFVASRRWLQRTYTRIWATRRRVANWELRSEQRLRWPTEARSEADVRGPARPTLPADRQPRRAREEGSPQSASNLLQGSQHLFASIERNYF